MDLEWLACSLALLDADVFAFSEVKANARARSALDTALRRAEALGGGAYQSAVDPCLPETGQHVALVWNTKITPSRSTASSTPTAGRAKGSFAPVSAATFASPAGSISKSSAST
jgi:hypothetical protein